jgi:hypothetical protein
MSFVIEGVAINNPAMVWTQLVNTRKSVLFRAERWNPSAWTGEHKEDTKDGFTRTVTTMCLANAIRYVTRGVYEKPEVYSRGTGDLDHAERLVLAVIRKRQIEGRSDPELDNEEIEEVAEDIPNYNDASVRRFKDIVEVLDESIALVRPLARVEVAVVADDVMTKAEKKEIDAKIRKAEDDIFQEQFGYWLTSHEKRGWKTFWEELLECDENDKKCQEKALALR